MPSLKTRTPPAPKSLRLRIRQSWKELERSAPGRRFQDLYERRRRAGHPHLKKIISIAGGLVLTAAGFFLLAFPGPGLLLIFAGMGMMAQYSKAASKALDKCEVGVRKLIAFGARMWERASAPLKGLIVVFALAVGSVPLFCAYALLF